MYRVMNTDYNTYAVIYGCRELDARGLCTIADSWIWSRFTELPANKLAVVEWAKRKLCVNTSMYLPTKQNNGKFAICLNATNTLKQTMFTEK